MKKQGKRNRERRVSPRFTISLPVTYNITVPPFKEKLKIRAQSKDISKCGIAFVASHTPSDIVMNLQIEVPPKDKGASDKNKTRKSPRVIRAKVRVIHSLPVIKRPKDIFRTGAGFLKLSKSGLTLLKELLARYHTK